MVFFKTSLSIKIEYFDEKWELVEEELSGIAARIVQHEYDHIDGIMISVFQVIKMILLKKQQLRVK